MKNEHNINRKGRPKWALLDRDKRGQGLVEYAMIIAMIVIVVILMLSFLGTVVFVNYYSKIGSSMSNVVQ